MLMNIQSHPELYFVYAKKQTPLSNDLLDKNIQGLLIVTEQSSIHYKDLDQTVIKNASVTYSGSYIPIEAFDANDGSLIRRNYILSNFPFYGYFGLPYYDDPKLRASIASKSYTMGDISIPSFGYSQARYMGIGSLMMSKVISWVQQFADAEVHRLTFKPDSEEGGRAALKLYTNINMPIKLQEDGKRRSDYQRSHALIAYDGWNAERQKKGNIRQVNNESLTHLIHKIDHALPYLRRELKRYREYNISLINLRNYHNNPFKAFVNSAPAPIKPFMLPDASDDLIEPKSLLNDPEGAAHQFASLYVQYSTLLRDVRKLETVIQREIECLSLQNRHHEIAKAFKDYFRFNGLKLGIYIVLILLSTTYILKFINWVNA